MQSRWMSVIEALCNVYLGWAVAFIAQLWVFPALGVYASLNQHIALSVIFTAISLIRNYVLRRGFVWLERARLKAAFQHRHGGGGSNPGACTSGPAGAAKHFHGHNSDRGSDGLM